MEVGEVIVCGFAVIGYFAIMYYVVKCAVKSALREMMESSDVVYVREEERKEVM